MSTARRSPAFSVGAGVNRCHFLRLLEHRHSAAGEPGRARVGAGLPRSGPDPLSRVVLDFEIDPLDLDRVSAELMVPREVLINGIPTGDPALMPLMAGTPIERAAFSAAFMRLLCAYHTAGVNVPIVCP